MTPTVLMEYTKERQQMKRGFNEINIVVPGKPEITGEYDGGASLIHMDSEDSSAPTRKCISLNGNRFSGLEVRNQVYPLSELSQQERKSLAAMLRVELKQTRELYNKLLLDVKLVTVPGVINGLAFSRAKKKKGNGSNVRRGLKGRFLPTKAAPEGPAAPPGAAISNAAVMRQCEALLNSLKAQKNSWVFHKPVDVTEYQVPDYFDIIKNPMDFGTIKKKMASGAYSSPWGFAADVRLTFSNAMTYNPPGHTIYGYAHTLSNFFERRWATIEKKLSAAKQMLAENEAQMEVERPDAQLKKRTTPLHVDNVVLMECMKPKMTDVEKKKLGDLLSKMEEELPPHIVEFLRQCTGNTDDNNYEIEIDMEAFNDNMLFELKKLLDDFMEQRKGQQARFEPSEVEVLNNSDLSNVSNHPAKGGEPMEEDVDICGNASPVLIQEYAQVRSVKLSSCSDSDSDSDSSSESESHERAASPPKPLKESEKSDMPTDQEKSDVITSLGANRPVNDLELQEQDSQPRPAPEGENAKLERQLSPDKLLRAAELRRRFADTIFKAQEKLIKQDEKGNPEKLKRELEELEKQRREEIARMEAEAKAAQAAYQAQAEAEAKRKRELERAAARQALQQMEKEVEINDSSVLKDLEMLRAAPPDHTVSSVDETSPDHSHDGMPGFMNGGNALEQLGLFMRHDDEEEEEDEPVSVPATNDTRKEKLTEQSPS